MPRPPRKRPRSNADAGAVEAEVLRAAVERALERRAALIADDATNAYRLLNGAGDGVDGLVIEQLGDVLVAQLHEGRPAAAERVARELATLVMERVGASAVYRKHFVKDRTGSLDAVRKDHYDRTPWIGTPAPETFDVVEHGVRYIVRAYDGYSTGLFLDHRDNRQRVRCLAAGRRVLNLFSYTCAYSVCAALGGAEEVVSVDLSRRFLERGKGNFAANGLSLEDRVFISSDTLDYYKRAKRQGRRFDLAILDPPSFSRDRTSKRVFVFEERLDELAAGAIELLEPGGVLLLCTNHRATSVKRLEAAVRAGAGDRRMTVTERPSLPDDFASDPDYAKSILVAFD